MTKLIYAFIHALCMHAVLDLVSIHQIKFKTTPNTKTLIVPTFVSSNLFEIIMNQTKSWPNFWFYDALPNLGKSHILQVCSEATVWLLM